MNNQIFISYRYRVGMIKGTETFRENLKSDYQIHEKPKWMPAAGGNFEMWFDFFINSPILKFLSSAIASGIAYDVTKQYVFKPFCDSLTKLNEENKGNLEIQTYRFNFDDITICVHGVFTNYTLIFGAIFNEVYKQIPYLLSQDKVKNLYEIHMPVDEDTGLTKVWDELNEPEGYLNCWRLDTDFGLMHYLYILAEKRIIEI